MEIKKTVRMFFALLCIQILLLQSICTVYGTDEGSCTSKLSERVEKLESELEDSKDRKTAEEVIEKTDDETVAAYYESLMNVNEKITSSIIDSSMNGDSITDPETVAEKVKSEFSEIQDIDSSIKSDESGSSTLTRYDVDLPQGKITVTLEDCPEQLSEASINTVSNAYYNHEIKAHKDFGDRYTSINNKSSFKGYPTSYFKFRMGYTLHKAKKISGRYIKAYEHEAGQNLTSRIKTEPIKSSIGWDKKAKNSDSIKAHCTYKQRFYISKKEVLTYNVKLNYSISIEKWNSSGAIISAKGKYSYFKIA